MKKVFFPFLLGFTIFCSNSNAQVDYDFEGYVFEIPLIQTLDADQAKLYNLNRTFFINLARLRLKPTLYLWDGGRLNIETESAFLYFDQLSAFFAANAKKTNRQLINLKWLSSGKNYSVLNFIDRFYLRQSFDFGSVTIGRQRIAWGTGRIWNPTDLFNPINPTAFYKIEKDGADAVSVKYSLGNFTDLNIVFNPMTKLNESNFGFRFRTNFNEFDFSVMGGKFDDRVVAGFDFAGNLWDAGLRGEAVFSGDENELSMNYMKFILGADYQFTAKLYGLVEYHFNGEGKTDRTDYEFQRLLKGEILNLGRNYLAFSVMYQLTPLLTTTLMNINNFDDKSGFAAISGSYSVTSDFYLTAGLQLFRGSNMSEYSFYPNSYYLQGEFYF